MKRSVFLGLMLLGFLYSKSQTGEQTSEFINKSYVALNKTQKEIMRLEDKTNEGKFKTALKYQAASVKYFKANNLKEAFQCSYKSRMECVDILKAIKPATADYFIPAIGEEQLLKQDYKTVKLPDGYLSNEELSKIDNLKVTDPQQLRELDINLN